MQSFFKSLFIEPKAGKEFLGYFLGGLFWCLSFPPFNLSFLGWVSLLPLFFLFKRNEGFGTTWVKTYLYLLITHTLTVYWICFSTFAGGMGAILVNPIFLMIPVTIWLMVRNRIKSEALSLVLLLFLWIVGEYFLSLWELAFPWMLLANGQYLISPLLQWASVGGAWMVSAFVFAFNILFYFLAQSWIHDRPITNKIRLLITFSVLMPVLIGFFIGQEKLPAVGKLKAGIIQPNVDPWIKWDKDLENYEQLMKLSDSLIQIDTSVNLIVWPETAISYYLLDDRGAFIRREMETFSSEHHTAILTGYPHIFYYEDSLSAPPSARWSRMSQKYYHNYNAATVIDGITEPHFYGKISLVPFAERVPWVDSVPFMKDLRFNLAGLGGWGKGKDTSNYVLARNPKAVFPSAICYESAFPEQIRTFVKKGATFLTVITNDGWWGNTSGYHQHFEFSRLRAIENHRWVVRSANNGISGFIDPHGNVIQSTDYWTERILSQEIDLISDHTLYQVFGDWFPQLLFVLSLGIMGLVLVRKRII